MVRALDDVFRRHDLDARVLVIDDSSPDGTGEIADRLADEFSFLSVLHRPSKEGLGPAYLAGFVWALATDADRIVEMDCDFSHDPEDLPRLLAASADADLVLGSRYVERGGTRNWGLGRRLVSRFGSLYARIILGVGIHDLDGGVQVLPPHGPRRDRAGADHDEGLRVPDRDDLSRAQGRLPRRRGADRLRRAGGRLLEDEPRHRSRGRDDGAGAAPTVAPEPSVTLAIVGSWSGK